MTLAITQLDRDDYTEWKSLYRAYGEFYNMPLDQKTLDTVWSWIFDSKNPFYALIAKDEQGNGVGLMHYREMPSPLRGAVVGFLDDLYIKPHYRGNGAVDAMFDALNDAAKAHGWPFVRWITAENNYRARAVYDRVATKTHWQTYQMDIG